LLNWRGAAVSGVHTVTLGIKEALGWDLEEAIMKAFRGLWAFPEYTVYMVSMKQSHGPPGSYLHTCEKCGWAGGGTSYLQTKTTVLVQIKTPGLRHWQCTCKSYVEALQQTVEKITTWPYSDECLSLGNLNGALYCEDWLSHGLAPPNRSYTGSCNQCHLSTSQTLYCRCRHDSGEWKATAIAVRDECVDIGNHNGTLTCQHESISLL